MHTIADICDACEGTGHYWWRGVAEDGADFAVESTLPCRWCDGTGLIECPAHLITLEELDEACPVVGE